MPTRQRLPGGFTLPDLTTTLAIAGMLALVTLPALAGTLARYQLKATGEALFTSLNKARATAIRRGHPTRVCPSEDGRLCSPAADWSLGWIARDQQAKALFDVSDTLPRAITIVHSLGRSAVNFQPDGTANHDNQRISLCVRGKAHTAVSIVLARSGRIRRETAPADIAAACARHRAKNA
jgi:type IV fimbrial biogenesis protein FimT